MARLTQFFHALLDIAFPPLCHICHAFIPNAETVHICPDCHAHLPRVLSPLCPLCGIPFDGAGHDHCCGKCLLHRPRFDVARAPFLYEGSVRDLIHSFKYNRRTHLRYPLALLTLEGIKQFLAESSPQLIVPVPLHRSRLRQRGFNQAVLLGRVLSKKLSLPMVPDALTRTRATVPQIGLSAAERRTNVTGAFTVKKNRAVEGKRILLLDDVMTTGSTMDECAGGLKKAGAAAIIAVTIARTAR
ncbi:MAG: ComF family protein [Desulfuromonadaceae bacterium]|nr:ComF family protein [Desulfuromonadaceae bacterium]MDD5104729.1 ComF family protein [Desulfuromonadaceae bacterium]